MRFFPPLHTSRCGICGTLAERFINGILAARYERGWSLAVVARLLAREYTESALGRHATVLERWLSRVSDPDVIEAACMPALSDDEFYARLHEEDRAADRRLARAKRKRARRAAGKKGTKGHE